ncbi:MAG: FkbM family methyltransferase [Verrucomicrobiota bacterium]
MIDGSSSKISLFPTQDYRLFGHPLMFITVRKILKYFATRGAPRCFEGLKHCCYSYSQFGEDLLVQDFFGLYKRSGNYIDIGAFHPIAKSNTYLFYRKGWRGLAIEPNPDLEKLWKRYRPSDQFVSAGVTASLEESKLLNYINHPMAPERNYISSEKSTDRTAVNRKVALLPIGQLTKRFQQMWNHLDLLNIDCEGLDFEILSAFPFDQIRPKCIVVDDFDRSTRSKTSKFLLDSRYCLFAQARISKIFVRLDEG